jgi:hypothetical protein
MSFLLEAVQAVQGGVYELKEFLRTRCRAVDSDISIAVGDGVQGIAVQFIEGIPPAEDEDLWLLLTNLSASSVEINRDRGEVTILVEFD